MWKRGCSRPAGAAVACGVAVAAAAAAAGVAVAAAVPAVAQVRRRVPAAAVSTDRPDKAVDAHRAAGLKTEPLPQAFRRVTDGGRNELVRLRAKLSEARKAAERQRLWPARRASRRPDGRPRHVTPSTKRRGSTVRKP